MISYVFASDLKNSVLMNEISGVNIMTHIINGLSVGLTQKSFREDSERPEQRANNRQLTK